MHKLPIQIVPPVLLAREPREWAGTPEERTVIRNIHVVNVGDAPARLYLTARGREPDQAWEWGRVIEPGASWDWPTYKALPPGWPLGAWSDVEGALCLSVDGERYLES